MFLYLLKVTLFEVTKHKQRICQADSIKILGQFMKKILYIQKHGQK